MPGQRWPLVGSRVLTRLLLPIGLLGLLATGLASAPDREDDPKNSGFTLAILRRDGILMPFAVYDGKHWDNPWPVPKKTANMPIAVSDIPKGWWHDKHPVMDWTLWQNTGTSRTIHVNGVTWVLAHCLQGAGLRTDYKPSVLPPPPRVQPYPKDGLAVSGNNIVVSPIELVNPTDKVALSLGALLPDAISPKEDELVARYMTHNSWTHSYTRDERARMHVDVEALYRVPHGLNGLDVYYFEAVKRYFLPKPPASDKRQAVTQALLPQESRCDLVTFASGWFTMKATGTIGNLVPRVHISGCDFARTLFMLPLGTITVDGKTLWIVQWSNAHEEAYAIFAPSAQDERVVPVLETPGGICEKKEDDEAQ